MSIVGKEVLIVDDMEIPRMVASRIVRNAGMIPSEAQSVGSALSCLERKTPHLILLDLGLFGRSGFDFLGLRSLDESMARIPVIVMSATSDKGSMIRARDLGVADYIVKPVSAAELLRKIKGALQNLVPESYRFPAGHQERAAIQFQATIAGSKETDFFLESAVRLAPGTQVRVRSPYLDRMGLASCVFVARSSANTLSPNGSYYNQIDVMGLPVALTRLIKKAGLP